jgi:hypothetical protein
MTNAHRKYYQYKWVEYSLWAYRLMQWNGKIHSFAINRKGITGYTYYALYFEKER